MANSQYNQTDAQINRDSWSRFCVAATSILVTLVGGYLLGSGLASWFGLHDSIGMVAGIIVGGSTCLRIASRSYIQNDTVTAFVTVDSLSTVLKKQEALVSYGPGFHFCYWWESRSSANTVNLSEVAEKYEVEVLTEDGTVKVTFSARIRPDIRWLPEFIAGVGSVAEDLGDIISAHIVDIVSKMNVEKARTSVASINDELRNKFSVNDTDFEQRFGVIVGDITIGSISGSKEVNETLNALKESKIIDQIVCESFGYDSPKKLQAAVRNKKVDGVEVNRRRTQTMALSGNLQGMNLSEQTFNLQLTGLNDIDPELIREISSAAPAIAAFFAAKKSHTSNKQPPKNNKGGAK